MKMETSPRPKESQRMMTANAAATVMPKMMKSNTKIASQFLKQPKNE